MLRRPAEMAELWAHMTADADLVNGYKPADRTRSTASSSVGCIITSCRLFGLTVRDVDCDFRLMRRSIFDRIQLRKTSGVICLEMIKKIEDAGFRIVEVPVHHYHRAFGSHSSSISAASSRPASTCSVCGSSSILRQHRRASHTRSIHTGDVPGRFRVERDRVLPRALSLPRDDAGGLGFIGSNLAHQLAALDRRPARRFADSRLRRQSVQHRRHRRSRSRTSRTSGSNRR